MQKLLSDLKNLNIEAAVNKKLTEFENQKNIFSELSFCILTANYNAERAIQIQKTIGKGFSTLSEKQLANKLKQLGYRYPNIRAKYITEARKYKFNLSQDDQKARDWLVKNIKGLGYKEASHFLRNIGYKNVAIIDFHIVDLLRKYNLTQIKKPINKTKYFEIENILKKISKRSKLNLAELDLYLWYMETGKILK